MYENPDPQHFDPKQWIPNWFDSLAKLTLQEIKADQDTRNQQ